MEFADLIANMGFPIACVVVLFYMQNKERESHQSEMKEITAAVNNNTLIMEKLLTQMEGMGYREARD